MGSKGKFELKIAPKPVIEYIKPKPVVKEVESEYEDEDEEEPQVVHPEPVSSRAAMLFIRPDSSVVISSVIIFITSLRSVLSTGG